VGLERENNLNKPFAAYSGDEPYMFVCYAHRDSAVVYADLVELRDNGVNRREVDEKGRNSYHFEADLLNVEGEAVARVSKEIYVRAKRAVKAGG
jgi:hypothetical protein